MVSAPQPPIYILKNREGESESESERARERERKSERERASERERERERESACWAAQWVPGTLNRYIGAIVKHECPLGCPVGAWLKLKLESQIEAWKLRWLRRRRPEFRWSGSWKLKLGSTLRV